MERELIQSVIKAFRILDVYDHKERELSIADLTERTGFSKSSVHRFVSTLVSIGIMEQNPNNQKYYLGIRLFELGQKTYLHLDLRNVAKEPIRKLVQLANETIHLVVMDNYEVLYIDKMDSDQAINMSSYIGQRIPAHCSGVGKVLLSFFSDRELEEYIKLKGLYPKTPNTITDPDVLREELKKVRQQGFAIDNEENEPFVRCIAAPVFNNEGKAIAAISLSGPKMRMTDETISGIIPHLKQAAMEISRKLGYPDD